MPAFFFLPPRAFSLTSEEPLPPVCQRLDTLKVKKKITTIINQIDADFFLLYFLPLHSLILSVFLSLSRARSHCVFFCISRISRMLREATGR